MKSPEISDKSRWFEILAVLTTAIGKFIFMDFLEWRLAYILVVILFWGFFIRARLRGNPTLLKHWGFRVDNFKASLKMVIPFIILSSLLCFFIGYLQNSLNLNWHIFPLLLLYPIWGIIQQFLLLSLLSGNFKDMKKTNFSNPQIIMSSSLIFGLIHLPTPWLVIGTFILSLVYNYIFLRIPNIYSLGVFHGWMAALFFYTVVDKDPFNQVFGFLFT